MFASIIRVALDRKPHHRRENGTVVGRVGASGAVSSVIAAAAGEPTFHKRALIRHFSLVWQCYGER